MTLEEAERVRNLLKARDALMHDLQTVEQCESITGNINVGSSGYGFAWRKKDGSCAIKYLIDGYKADIAAIDRLIAHLASPNFPET